MLALAGQVNRRTRDLKILYPHRQCIYVVFIWEGRKLDSCEPNEEANVKQHGGDRKVEGL